MSRDCRPNTHHRGHPSHSGWQGEKAWPPKQIIFCSTFCYFHFNLTKQSDTFYWYFNPHPIFGDATDKARLISVACTLSTWKVHHWKNGIENKSAYPPADHLHFSENTNITCRNYLNNCSNLSFFRFPRILNFSGFIDICLASIGDFGLNKQNKVFKAILASDCYHCIAYFFLLFFLADLTGWSSCYSAC